jgi:hypothetical protein
MIVKIYLQNYLLIMLLTDLPYFGSISFFQKIIHQESIFYDQDAPYTKMSFKNRMVIATAQGPLHLSIPIIGGRDQKCPIQTIQIAYDSPWELQHFKALVSNYQRAPFFEYYKDSLFDLYQTKPKNLLEFQITTNEWVRKQIKGDWLLSVIPDNSKQTDKWVDPWLPKNYQNYPQPFQYIQVFQDKTGILPNLSILDLLFNCGGKQSKQLLLL